MLLKKLTATCVVVSLILFAALLVSYVVDYLILGTPRSYTPLNTTIITILVGGPVGFVLISQHFNVRQTQLRLIDSIAEKDRAAVEIQQRRQEAEDAKAKAEQALEQLRDSEARYRLLTERATDMILRYDPAGMIEYMSPSIRQLGYQPEQLVGRNMSDFIHPDDLADVRRRRVETIGGRPVSELREVRVRRADGHWLWLEGSPATIRDDGGAVVGVVTVLRDVSDRKAMENELRRQRMAADASNIAKAEFVANMSHEIRTPLTGVIGFAGLLERMEGLPEQARRYINRITMGGQALLSIVNDVLDFSRLDAGQIELDPQPFDLQPFLKDTVDLVLADARKKGLDLRTEQGGDLPAVVRADSGRLRQVLLNLLSNAIKFTTEGSVTVTVSYQAEHGGRLRFEVADTGAGVSADYADRLFQRFSQVDGSNTRRHGGAGLGLAISKGLTEMMGGQIGVQSKEGRGSTFWFVIAAPAEAARETVAAKPEGDGESWHIAPMRIMVVDDVAVNRELVSTLLSPFDLQLTEAANGVEAVEAALHTSFDLILMDLQMPGMDGLAATRAIRANSDLNRRTPILALSANVLPVHVEACRQAGMNDHIGKPINPRELLSKIDRWATPA